MTIVEITGSMLRAARSLTGLTQQELADRASISRPCLALATPNTTAGSGSDVLKSNESSKPSTEPDGSFPRKIGLEPMPVLPRALALETPATFRTLFLLHICCSRVSSLSAIAPKVPEGVIVSGADALNSGQASEALPRCD
jgi:hypothetical protein